MPSLLPGFEYDIFISYRHNDNRSGWVTAFAENLAEELSATIKDPVSVYFDTNPHDGLLETHSVDKSLEGKLKCLIFIPIISQTYCDPKSFAWKHEFLAFNRIAKDDLLGRDVKLPNGNVASRILPVKIHDLDAADKSLLESELGGVLRSIDFIYKSSGVNRPLRANEDHPQDNLNKTYYLDQINKVANAVKEIIASLRNSEDAESSVGGGTTGDDPLEQIPSSRRKWFIMAGLAILFFSIALYFVKPDRWIRAANTQPKSIAVLPFQNLSGDTEQEYISDGIMEEIINQLVKIHQLSVTSLHSSMVYKDSKKPLKNIGNELGVANILEGKVQRSGNQVRVAVQLIDARTEKNLWSEIFVRDANDLFSIEADISKNIASELQAVLSLRDVENLNLVPTTVREAYDYYLRSLYYERKDDWIKGIEMCNKAIALDPKFTLAYVLRASWNGTHYFNKWPTWEGRDKLAKADIEKATQLNPNLPEVKLGQAMTLFYTERKYDSAIHILSRVLEDRPNDVQVYYWLGTIQRRQGLWLDSRRNMDRAVAMEPNNTNILIRTAYLYYVLRHYDKAIELANKALSIDPEVGTAGLVVYRSLLAWRGNVKAANNAIVYNSEGTHLESISDSMRLEWARHYYNRQFGELLLLNDQVKGEITEDQNHYEPRSLNAARIHYLNGDLAQSKKYALKAITILNDRLKLTDQDYRIHSALGYAHAFAGNFREAISFGKKANDLMPVELDAFSGGLTSEQSLAEIYIITGEYELAMDRLVHLLSIPGDISVQILKVDPIYDKLRSVPRFNKILNTEYKSAY